jgi:arylsulfatase A-like enzyme
MTDRPNLLFLMTDQHRWDALGIVRPEVKTPHLDALAARGIHFNQAVCQNPQCVASRYSLTTGLYPSQVGVRNNNQAIQRDADMPIPTLFERLRDLGYQTIGSGKTHWYMHQHEGRDTPPIEPSTRGFDWRYIGRRSGGSDQEPGAVYFSDDSPENMAWMADYTKKVGPSSGGESFEGYMGCTAPMPGDGMREHWLTTKAIEALRRCENRKQPWHLYLSFDFPHAPLAVPSDFEDLYSLDDIPDVEQPPPDLPRHYNMWHSDEIVSKWRALPEKEQRQIWRRYFALCSYVDAQFGRVFDYLRESGQEENTFVVFTADHGDSLGERDRFSKYSLYEGSVRVPLILAGAGVSPARQGSTDSRAAELVDLVPTFLDAAGERIPDELPGESLLQPSHRAGSFAEFHGHGFDEILHAPAYMWRTREWKLILYFDGNVDELRRHPEQIQGELFDLRNDPKEYANLYNHPGHRNQREALTRNLLVQLMINASHFPRHASYSYNRPHHRTDT